MYRVGGLWFYTTWCVDSGEAVVSHFNISDRVSLPSSQDGEGRFFWLVFFPCS